MILGKSKMKKTSGTIAIWLQIILLIAIFMFSATACQKPAVSEREIERVDKDADENVNEEDEDDRDDVIERIFAEASQEEETEQKETFQEKTDDSEPVDKKFSIESVAVETTDYPVIICTINGEEKRLEYPQYEGLFIEYALDTIVEDVTGDGTKDLLVSIYIVGNTLHDYLQDTYVYRMDDENGELTEIFSLMYNAGEKYLEGYPNNIGAYVTTDGNLELHLATHKENATFETEVVYLSYKDGQFRHMESDKKEKTTERVFDEADVLTDEEEGRLREQIAEYEEELKLDIVIVTMNESLEEYARSYEPDVPYEEFVRIYADNFYDEHQFGYNKPCGDGILLLDNIYREDDGYVYTWMSTCGSAIEQCNSQMIDDLLDDFCETVDGDAYEAYRNFLNSFYFAMRD